LQVGPRISEYLKTKNYTQFKEALDTYRELSESGAIDSENKSEIKTKIVGFIEDFLLSV
jgi:uncharacterized protein YjgD (DUF1641 family)